MVRAPPQTQLEEFRHTTLPQILYSQLSELGRGQPASQESLNEAVALLPYRPTKVIYFEVLIGLNCTAVICSTCQLSCYKSTGRLHVYGFTSLNVALVRC